MYKVKCEVEYNGSNYLGMASSADRDDFEKKSIQKVIEVALLSFSGKAQEIEYASRTDSGVHAIGQVVSFFVSEKIDLKSVVHGMNFFLKRENESVRIKNAQRVEDDFHPRHSAKMKHYLYRVLCNGYPTCFSDGYLMEYKPLDIEKMKDAAKFFVGKKDFSSFRSKGCQSRSPLKTISNISITKSDSLFGKEVLLKFSARSFLYHMVRNIVGSLLEVGRGKKDPIWIEKVLLKKDRSIAGPMASANGLFLYEIDY